VQYSLPGFAAGSSSVRLRWGIGSNPSQNDIGWNIDDVEVLGGGAVDSTPPVAIASVANITSGGSPTHSFTVTYTDNTAVAVASLGSSNLVVTGPNGYSNFVDFIGVDTLTDGTPRIASYSIAAPGSAWSAADNGTYQIVLQADQVKDTLNNAVAQATLGTFTVAINTNVQALVVSPTLLSVPEGSNSVFTIRLAAQPSSSVTVTVARVSGDADLIVQSGATNVFTSVNWSNPVPVLLSASPDSDQANGTAAFECQSESLAPVAVSATEQDTTPDNLLTVTVNNVAWGSVQPGTGFLPVGASVLVRAMSSNYFRFTQWTGSYSTTNNPLLVALDTNVTLQAVFAEIVTTNHATPQWWLASFGYTNDFENAENIIGANGTPLWQSYIAGLNPNDPNSQLRLFIEGATVLRWNAATGRVYSIWHGTNLSEPFTPLSSGTNLLAPVQSFTNPVNAPATFYRLEVRKP
jgi:hypothetical protein